MDYAEGMGCGMQCSSDQDATHLNIWSTYSIAGACFRRAGSCLVYCRTLRV